APGYFRRPLRGEDRPFLVGSRPSFADRFPPLAVLDRHQRPNHLGVNRLADEAHGAVGIQDVRPVAVGAPEGALGADGRIVFLINAAYRRRAAGSPGAPKVVRLDNGDQGAFALPYTRHAQGSFVAEEARARSGQFEPSGIRPDAGDPDVGGRPQLSVLRSFLDPRRAMENWPAHLNEAKVGRGIPGLLQLEPLVQGAGLDVRDDRHQPTQALLGWQGRVGVRRLRESVVDIVIHVQG